MRRDLAVNSLPRLLYTPKVMNRTKLISMKMIDTKAKANPFWNSSPTSCTSRVSRSFSSVSSPRRKKNILVQTREKLEVKTVQSTINNYTGELSVGVIFPLCQRE